jgi:hypothetical protein
MFLFKSRHNTIIGKWHNYVWWTKNGKSSLEEMYAVVKRGILHEYKVTFDDDTSHYSGEGHMENKDFCIQLSAHDHLKKKDTVAHRYCIPIIEERHILFGIWLSYDADEKVSAGGTILSRTKLGDPEIKQIIDNNYVIHPDIPLMALK